LVGKVERIVADVDDAAVADQRTAGGVSDEPRTLRDELPAVQIAQILQGLRNAYAEADRRAMDGLTDKFDEKPDATTIADAVSEDEPEAEGSDDFDPENDLELQDDTPAEEDELTKNIRKLAEKAPKVVDLLKEIFG
jgi:hypothetical protein